MLDSRGKVIGVVRSGLVARGLGRTGINQAVPVSAVRGSWPGRRCSLARRGWGRPSCRSRCSSRRG